VITGFVRTGIRRNRAVNSKKSGARTDDWKNGPFRCGRCSSLQVRIAAKINDNVNQVVNGMIRIRDLDHRNKSVRYSVGQHRNFHEIPVRVQSVEDHDPCRTGQHRNLD